MNIPFCRLGGEVPDAVHDVFRSGLFIYGPYTEQLEEDLEDFLNTGRDSVVTVGSGADALFLSLEALGVGPGDEVITVAHTHVSTVAAIIHCGATPVLVDIGPSDLIDPSLAEAAITDRTRAIIPVHLNGHMVDDELSSTARDRGILYIEDACQALGVENTFAVGAGIDHRASCGCFSLHPMKALHGAGDGGFVVTRDELLARRLRELRNHGTEWGVQRGIGYSSRLGEVNAAVAVAMLPGLRKAIDERWHIMAAYDLGLAGSGVVTGGRGEYGYNIRHPRRDALAKHLADAGIGTRVCWDPPLHKALHLPFVLPVTEALSAEVVALPLYPELTEDEQGYVVEQVWKFTTGTKP